MNRIFKTFLLAAAAFVLLAGCNDAEEPIVPAEDDAAQTEDLAEVEVVADEEVIRIAENFIEQLTQGQYEEATEKFDETMKEQLTAAELEQLWESLNEQLGEFIDHEYNQTEIVNDYQVVLIDGVFNDADARFQVTIDANKEIAGFYIQ